MIFRSDKEVTEENFDSDVDDDGDDGCGGVGDKSGGDYDDNDDDDDGCGGVENKSGGGDFSDDDNDDCDDGDNGVLVMVMFVVMVMTVV